MSLCFVGHGRPLSNGERRERGVQLGVASEEAHKIAIVQVRVLHHGRWGTTSISDYLSHLPLANVGKDRARTYRHRRHLRWGLHRCTATVRVEQEHSATHFWRFGCISFLFLGLLSLQECLLPRFTPTEKATLLDVGGHRASSSCAFGSHLFVHLCRSMYKYRKERVGLHGAV